MRDVFHFTLLRSLTAAYLNHSFSGNPTYDELLLIGKKSIILLSSKSVLQSFMFSIIRRSGPQFLISFLS